MTAPAAPRTHPPGVPAVVALTCAVVLTTAFGWSGPAVLLVVATFMALVPGWVLASLMRLPVAGVSRLAVAVALSLAVMTELALISLWLHAWQPEQALYLVAGAVFVAVACDEYRSRR